MVSSSAPMQSRLSRSNTEAPGGRWPSGSAPNILHALFMVCCQLATFIVGFGVLVPLLGLRFEHPYDGSLAAIVAVALTGSLQLVLVVGLGIMRWASLSPRDLGWVRPTARDGFLGLVGVSALVACMVVIVSLFGSSIAELSASIASFSASQRVQMLLIGLIAAAVEETLFRGYLQPSLVVRLGTARGVVATALIFSLYHAPFMPQLPGLLAKFLFGLVLGALRARSGSVVAPAIAHFGLWQIMGFA